MRPGLEVRNGAKADPRVYCVATWVGAEAGSAK
jgi:hypothetical protein